MIKRFSKYQLSHFILRLVVAVNFSYLLLMYYQPYFRVVRQIFRQGGDVYLMMISSLFLPLYVGFETWWMYRVKPSQTKGLIIDWVIAALWVVVLWGIVIYARTHYF
jgi:hypothetical protein